MNYDSTINGVLSVSKLISILEAASFKGQTLSAQINNTSFGVCLFGLDDIESDVELFVSKQAVIAKNQDWNADSSHSISNALLLLKNVADMSRGVSLNIACEHGDDPHDHFQDFTVQISEQGRLFITVTDECTFLAC